MDLGECFASHLIMSCISRFARSRGPLSPSLASSRITVFKHDVLGNEGRISVRIIKRTASGVHCGTSQLLNPSCQAVVDAMPVNKNKIQMYGPPGDKKVTVPLPWSLEKSDPGEPRNKHSYL